MEEKVKNFVVGQRYKSRLGLVECIHRNSVGSPIGEFIDNPENGWGSPEKALKEYSYKSKYTGKFYGLFENDGWTLAVEESKPKFKVGDRVRIAASCYGLHESHGLPDGHVGYITHDDRTNHRQYRVDNKEAFIAEDELELVEESKPKFKVGDRVKYINKEKEGYNISFWELGGYGTVTDLGQEQGGTKCFDSEKSVYVTIDQEYTEREGTRDSVVSKSNLELVEDEPMKAEYWATPNDIKCDMAYGVSGTSCVYKRYVDSAININAQQEQPNNNMNEGFKINGENSMISKFKDLLMSEPKKSLLKYRVEDREENLTSEGKDLFINWLYSNKDTKKAFFEEVISEFIKAEEKESKKK